MRYPVKDFIIHARYAHSYGGKIIELQLSDDGSAARYRITLYSYNGKPKFHYGYWQEVKYTKRGRPYIMDWHAYKTWCRRRRLHLDNFIKINSPWC